MRLAAAHSSSSRCCAAAASSLATCAALLLSATPAASAGASHSCLLIISCFPLRRLHAANSAPLALGVCAGAAGAKSACASSLAKGALHSERFRRHRPRQGKAAGGQLARDRTAQSTDLHSPSGSWPSSDAEKKESASLPSSSPSSASGAC